MSDTVLRDLKDGVLTLTLNRLEKKNAFSTEQWKACATIRSCCLGLMKFSLDPRGTAVVELSTFFS